MNSLRQNGLQANLSWQDRGSLINWTSHLGQNTKEAKRSEAGIKQGYF